MMNNNVMVQELTDSQLDMITGGGILDELRGIANKAWVITKYVAKKTAEAAEEFADTTVEVVKAVYNYRETR